MIVRVHTALAVLVLMVPAARAQTEQGTTLPLGDVFATNTEAYYADKASTSCTEKNTSPYAGMNPLVCYGVMAPTDSAGKCTLGNMKVLKQEGNTCYYCQVLNPPTQGFIIPIDNLAQASREGFTCGVDQADPNCMAVCKGNGVFNPPDGTTRTSPPNGSETPTTATGSNKPPLQGYVTNEPPPQQTQPTPSPETPGGLPLPPDVRQQLMNGAAQLDKVADDTQAYALAATDHFFRCLAEALSADMKFLAQPGYVPAAQIAQSLHQGVWSYLTSDAYSNNLGAYQAAQQSLNSFKQDPACGLANIVPTAAAIAVTHLSGAVAEANAAQTAANDAMKLATEESEREAAWQSGPGKFGANPANPFNPACAPNMCFPSALAQDLSWQTGEPLAAQPFAGNVTVKIVQGEPTNVYNLTSSKTIQTFLSDMFGSKGLQGPALSSDRIANQMVGKPSLMQSGTQIQQEIAAAGPGARGLVFVEYAPTATDPDPAGHVFNVRNFNGVPQAIDASNAGMNASTFFNGVSKIWFYRTQ